MQQVRLFKGIESEAQTLEREVNDWIRQSGAKVVSITGNIAPQGAKTEPQGRALGGAFVPSDVILIVLYETPAM